MSICTDTKRNSPGVNLLGLTPPKVSSPFVLLSDVVGRKEIPTTDSLIRPWATALSVMVGTQLVISGPRSVPGGRL